MKQKGKKTDTIDLLSRVKETGLCPQLHPHLMKYTGYCMLKAGMRIRARVDTGLEEWGLVAPQFGILTLLDHDGPVTQIELGTYMAIDKATMVRFLDSLEEKGFITRTASTDDRRAKVIEITKSGKQAMAKMEMYRREAEDSVLNVLSAQERKQLKEILQKLLDPQSLPAKK